MNFIFFVTKALIILSFCFPNIIGMNDKSNQHSVSSADSAAVIGEIIHQQSIYNMTLGNNQHQKSIKSIKESEMEKMMQEWSDKNLKSINDDIRVLKDEVKILKKEKKEIQKNKKSYFWPSFRKTVFVICIFAIGMVAGNFKNQIMSFPISDNIAHRQNESHIPGIQYVQHQSNISEYRNIIGNEQNDLNLEKISKVQKIGKAPIVIEEVKEIKISKIQDVKELKEIEVSKMTDKGISNLLQLLDYALGMAEKMLSDNAIGVKSAEDKRSMKNVVMTIDKSNTILAAQRNSTDTVGYINMIDNLMQKLQKIDLDTAGASVINDALSDVKELQKKGFEMRLFFIIAEKK